MIEELLPDCVHAVEAFEDAADLVLFPAEEAVVARAVAKRRREFTTVRGCARTALARLGIPPAPILPGPRGAPHWPAGVVGSMTHCDGYRAAAVARVGDLHSIGVDAEPNRPLPGGVLNLVSSEPERAWVARLAVEHPDTCWDRLVFSAKESVYKTWFPLTGQWLDFHEAQVAVWPEHSRFVARLLVPGPVVDGTRVDEFTGRWLVRQGLVVTAITVPRRG